MQRELIKDLRSIQVPFILRVAQGPDPLHDLLELRLPQIVAAEAYWDWSYYSTPDDRTSAERMLKEIEALYCDQEMEPDTSTVGFIDSGYFSHSSALVVGTIFGDAGEEDFVPEPWLIEELGNRLTIQPTKIYKYEWQEDQSGGLTMRRGRVLDERADVDSTWRSMMEWLPEREPKQWAFSALSPWSTERSQELQQEAARRIGQGGIQLRSGLGSLRSEFGTYRWYVFWLGFMLSPLTPYNDFIVNAPLAALLTWVVVSATDLQASWVLPSAYLLTNIIGFVLMTVGVRGEVEAVRRVDWRMDIRQIAVVSLQALAVVGGSLYFILS